MEGEGKAWGHLFTSHINDYLGKQKRVGEMSPTHFAHVLLF